MSTPRSSHGPSEIFPGGGGEPVEAEIDEDEESEDSSDETKADKKKKTKKAPKKS